MLIWILCVKRGQGISALQSSQTYYQLHLLSSYHNQTLMNTINTVLIRNLQWFGSRLVVGDIYCRHGSCYYSPVAELPSQMHPASMNLSGTCYSKPVFHYEAEQASNMMCGGRQRQHAGPST